MDDLRLPAGALGLAVSGGSDSLALMYLAAEWAASEGRQAEVVTIDHRLRPEAAAEAAHVAACARAAGLPHTTLRWTGWDGRGNLQDAARTARRRLIGAWAAERGLQAVLTGHTEDDQAETVLMRLARGSGIDGLAGIAPLAQAEGLTWARPLLSTPRAALRDWLRARGALWCDDPSNDDPSFDRVKARRLIAELGLSRQRLSATAQRLRAAAEALDAAANAFAVKGVTIDRGDLLIDGQGLFALAQDLRERLLAAALGWVSGAPYRPRHSALQRLLAQAAEGQGGTLHGCLVTPTAGTLRIAREPAAVTATEAAATALWDGRWQLTGPWQPGDTIRATGAALAQVPAWRAAGLPRSSLLAAPAVWRAGQIQAAPLAGWGQGFVAELTPGRDHFTLGAKAH